MFLAVLAHLSSLQAGKKDANGLKPWACLIA